MQDPMITMLTVVGHGVYLKPERHYELRSILIPREDQESWRPYYSMQTKQTYLIPKHYEVNDSPPIPTKKSLNHLIIEESWEMFDEKVGLHESFGLGNGIVYSALTLMPANYDNYNVKKIVFMY